MAYGQSAPTTKRFAEDYIDVAERLRAWYDAYPNGRVETEIVTALEHQDILREVEAVRALFLIGVLHEAIYR